MKEVVKDPKKEKKILETSTKLFGQYGYRETKTDQIAEEAGVSKGLLFHYYGNKGAHRLFGLDTSLGPVGDGRRCDKI